MTGACPCPEGEECDGTSECVGSRGEKCRGVCEQGTWGVNCHDRCDIQCKNGKISKENNESIRSQVDIATEWMELAHVLLAGQVHRVSGDVPKAHGVHSVRRIANAPPLRRATRQLASVHVQQVKE